MTRLPPRSLPASISLLDGALGYTRDRLMRVTTAQLGRPTPCTDWDLHALLEHMDDSLDAFLESAGGSLDLHPRPLEPGAADLCTRLQVKACALAEVWRGAEREGRFVVEVGGHQVPAALLVDTAALEITVHGWDVARATGDPARVPADLARRLGGIAREVVTPADRGVRFAPPVMTTPDAPPDHALLAHLGRTAALPGHSWRIPPPGAGAAS